MTMNPALPKLPHSPLARELTVVLAVKLVLLAALWAAFFRAPAEGTRVATADHVLAPLAAARDR